jgi:uncharacterized protein involved in exopolysaccharide biosynthesis
MVSNVETRRISSSLKREREELISQSEALADRISGIDLALSTIDQYSALVKSLSPNPESPDALDH